MGPERIKWDETAFRKFARLHNSKNKELRILAMKSIIHNKNQQIKFLRKKLSEWEKTKN